MKDQMKSESCLIIEFALALLLLGVLSFFFIPVYEKGLSAALTTFQSALIGLLGYKFGRSIPQQTGDAKPGQQTKSETTTTVASPAPEPSPVAPPPVTPSI